MLASNRRNRPGSPLTTEDNVCLLLTLNLPIPTPTPARTHLHLPGGLKGEGRVTVRGAIRRAAFREAIFGTWDYVLTGQQNRLASPAHAGLGARPPCLLD